MSRAVGVRIMQDEGGSLTVDYVGDPTLIEIVGLCEYGIFAAKILMVDATRPASEPSGVQQDGEQR